MLSGWYKYYIKYNKTLLSIRSILMKKRPSTGNDKTSIKIPTSFTASRQKLTSPVNNDLTKSTRIANPIASSQQSANHHTNSKTNLNKPTDSSSSIIHK